MVRAVDREAAARAVAAFLKAIGHEPVGDLEETPGLVAEAWCSDLLSGRDEDPAAILRAGSIPHDDDAGLVALKSLAVTTMCPHHLMPAHGTADIAYLPGDRVAGFGAIARALRAATRRLTLQETAGATVARLLVEQLGARGAACRLRLAHTCLIARGARESGALVETVALAGDERDLVLGALGP